MSFKFPFTNYHELNLTWVLDKLKELFEESAENVSTIQNYDGRLTAVETELPGVSETASEASRSAAAAGTLAQTAKATADTAQENAIQAQRAAGTAQNTAERAQEAADAATQAAQQAQATAQNFDGRITQAENDASQALEASRSFENRVQSAITTANNANQTATNAQGIAMRADQNAGAALDKIGDLSQLTTTAKQNLVTAINEAAQSGGVISVNGKTGAVALDADDIGYNDTTVETALDGKQNAPTAAGTAGQVLGLNNSLQPVWIDQTDGGDNSNYAPLIINTAFGAIASFSDGADNRQIRKIVGTIVPVQSGTGDPSPDNVRPISGWTGAEIERTGVNVWDEEWEVGTIINGVNSSSNVTLRSKNYIPVVGGETYYFSAPNNKTKYVYYYDANKTYIMVNDTILAPATFTVPSNAKYMRYAYTYYIEDYTTYNHDISINYPSADTTYHAYTGNQISVTFPSEAGTVYGGTLTVNPDRTGTLVANMAKKKVRDINFTFVNDSTVDPNSKVFRSSEYASGNDAMGAEGGYCDTFKIVTLPSSWSGLSLVNGECACHNSRFIFASSEYSTIADFKSAYGDVKVVYYLAKKIEYQLTAEQVSGILTALYGTNNIWANTGDVTVEYSADTKLYIDGKIAELQALVLENNG